MKNRQFLAALIGMGIAFMISGSIMITVDDSRPTLSAQETTHSQMPSVELAEETISEETIPEDTISTVPPEPIIKEVIKEVVKEVPIPMSDEEIKQRAIELGMVYETKANERIIRLKTINITENSSGEIAKRLEKEGIIDNADKFHDYIRKQGKTRSLRTGNREFKVNSTYEEALKSLT